MAEGGHARQSEIEGQKADESSQRESWVIRNLKKLVRSPGVTGDLAWTEKSCAHQSWCRNSSLLWMLGCYRMWAWEKNKVERAVLLSRYPSPLPPSAAALGKMSPQFAEVLHCLSTKSAVKFFLPTLSLPRLLGSACLPGLDSLQGQDLWNLSSISEVISAGRQLWHVSF